MEDRSVIIEHEKKLIDAQLKSDVNKLNDLLHEDLLFTIPNGQIITKQIDLESHGSGEMVVDSSTVLEQTIKFIEDIAIAISTVELKGRYKDQPINGKFVYNRVWKQFKGQWKLVAGSAISIT